MQIPWPPCHSTEFQSARLQPRYALHCQELETSRKGDKGISQTLSSPLSIALPAWIKPPLPSSSQSRTCCSAWCYNDKYNHTNCIFHSAWCCTENWWSWAALSCYQSCRNWVGFRKCQCSPSVYVPCNLAVSLSCCTRAGNPSKEKQHKLPSTVPWFPFTFWLQTQSWKECWMWNTWGFLESWPQCLSLRLSQQFFWFGKFPLFSRQWMDHSRE